MNFPVFSCVGLVARDLGWRNCQGLKTIGPGYIHLPLGGTLVGWGLLQEPGCPYNHPYYYPHEFHETCHSVTFIALVNSNQRWKQMRNRVCFHLWCELTLTSWCHSTGLESFFMKWNVTEWQVSWKSWYCVCSNVVFVKSVWSSCHFVSLASSTDHV